VVFFRWRAALNCPEPIRELKVRGTDIFSAEENQEENRGEAQSLTIGLCVPHFCISSVFNLCGKKSSAPNFFLCRHLVKEQFCSFVFEQFFKR
jgi:hypothetical protein